MTIPYARFGRTNHLSSRIIFGAAALGAMSQERADQTIDYVVSRGVNHFDTAASYGDSELRLAPWLATHRSEIFLATKTDQRTGSGARAQLELSLERMGVDNVDLIQFHNLVAADDWAAAHAPGGAIEAMVQARDEGLVRFLGVTGHGVNVVRQHQRSLERFDFDSVLFPYNTTMLMEGGYEENVNEILATCATRDVAVQTIKSVAKRRWITEPERAFSWYEALDANSDALVRSVRFVLSNQQVFLNMTSDTRLLPSIIDAAEGDLTCPTSEQIRSDIEQNEMRSLFNELTPI